MAIHLNSSVAELPGIGTQAVKDFKQLGIVSVRDLLLSMPFRYDDFSDIRKIKHIRAGLPVTVEGTITRISARPSKNYRMQIVEAELEDETGMLPVIWFNQEYLARTIRPGTQLSLSGAVDIRFKRALVNPVHEPFGRRLLTGRLVPVYRLSGSLKMHRVRVAIKSALSAVRELGDWLPEPIRQEESFVPLPQAIEAIHFPESHAQLTHAIERLKFDELFLHQMMFAQVRQERSVRLAHVIQIDKDALKICVASLPFELTPAQKIAAWEIVQDLAQSNPMNRLLQGDVGSGKTVVAVIAASRVLAEKKLVVYLAPTEILVAQQHAVFARFFPNEPVALFTRTQKQIGTEKVKKEMLIEQISSGTVHCVVGTHALLEEQIALPHLAFVIIDEQHRFGVAQRRALLEKGGQFAPHLLSMTATPIPRSLALTIYGDLDLSIIHQMPKGRKPVGTAVVDPSQRTGMWQHVKDQIEEGRQAFVICPLIDPSDSFGAKSVTETCSLLKKGVLSGMRLDMLHGKLRGDEKQRIIEKFREKQIDVLVSTTVVEVGVDIPNATVMIIMGAERFGLAQLHQLRGRVGRSTHMSYCYLLSDDAIGQAQERLRLLEQTHNGFELAEKDLELRGAGNVFGNAQSGFPDFKLATPADVDIMKKARDYAARLLTSDPKLDTCPLLREQMRASFEAVHLE